MLVREIKINSEELRKAFNCFLIRLLFFHGQHQCTCTVFRLLSHKRAAKYDTKCPNPCLYESQWHTMGSTDLGARKKKEANILLVSALCQNWHFTSIFSTKIAHISEHSQFCRQRNWGSKTCLKSEAPWVAEPRFAVYTASKPRPFYFHTTWFWVQGLSLAM